MSMSPNEIPGTPGIFLMRRRDWFHRVAMGIPEKPAAGDWGDVRHALLDLIDAAGGLEFSRGELLRVIGIAQEEYSLAMRAWNQQSDQRVIDAWGGATVPAVYFAFFEAVTWTRTVIDRFQEPLKEVVHPHDRELWKSLQRIRSESGGQLFDDARTLAGISLHWYSPPHAGCGAKIVNGTLIYPVVDNVDDKQDFRNNLNFSKGRHAEMLVEEYWKAVCIFIDRVLDEFYPQ
jgi:hypothetical protein